MLNVYFFVLNCLNIHCSLEVFFTVFTQNSFGELLQKEYFVMSSSITKLLFVVLYLCSVCVDLALYLLF